MKSIHHAQPFHAGIGWFLLLGRHPDREWQQKQAFGKDGGQRQTKQLHVGWLFGTCHDVHHRDQLARVAGTIDVHARNRPHDGQILKAHVGSPIGALRDAGAGADNLHVVAGVGNADGVLIVGPPRGKAAERGAEGNLALRSQSRGNGNHVGFGHADIDEVARKALYPLGVLSSHSKMRRHIILKPGGKDGVCS